MKNDEIKTGYDSAENHTLDEGKDRSAKLQAEAYSDSRSGTTVQVDRPIDKNLLHILPQVEVNDKDHCDKPYVADKADPDKMDRSEKQIDERKGPPEEAKRDSSKTASDSSSSIGLPNGTQIDPPLIQRTAKPDNGQDEKPPEVYWKVDEK